MGIVNTPSQELMVAMEAALKFFQPCEICNQLPRYVGSLLWTREDRNAD